MIWFQQMMGQSKMKRLNIIYILLIIILLLLPFSINAFEKFDGSIFKFVKQCKKFSTRHYAGRNLFISMYCNLRLALLKESPLPDRILCGKDDFLFYCKRDDGDNIVDYQGYIQLSNNELESIYVFLNSFYEWLKQRNIAFYFIVAPDKQTIYDDKLPEKIKKIGRTSTDQIIDYLIKKGIPVIDLRHPLLEAKSLFHFDLYLKTDTHWNSLGSYIAYKSIINKLANDGISIKPINIDLRTINKKQLTILEGRGDSYKMMKITKDPYFYDADLHYPRDYTTEYPEGEVPYPKVTVTKNNKNTIKAVIYMDSFFCWLQPYLSNTFGYTYYLWEYLYKTKKIEKDKIEELKPDVVMIETVERFLKYYKDIAPIKIGENSGKEMQDDITNMNMS